MSNNTWMDKEDMVCEYTHTRTHNEIALSDKKEWNCAILSNMDGLEGHYVKWSKSDIERQILYDILICGIQKI